MTEADKRKGRRDAVDRTYDKLIRDHIPQIIEEQGEYAVTRKLDDREYLFYLNKKLREETGEYFDADARGEVSESIRELGDILEVAYAIAAARDVPAQWLNEIREEKARKRGAFEKRLLLEKVIGNE